MLNLIFNEVEKLIYRKKLYVFLVLLLGINLIFCISMKYVANNNEGAEVMDILSGQSVPLNMLDGFSDMIAIFAIIIITDMLTDEYISGTIKLPLLRPVTRSKLLSAKIITAFLTIVFMFLFSMITCYITGTIFFGWGNELTYAGQSFSVITGIFYTLGGYLITAFPITAFTMISVFIALRMSAVGSAIGASIGTYFLLKLVSQLSAALRPYIIITYFPLSGLFLQNEINTALLGIIVTCVYILLFGSLSFIHFKQKDILE